jgi:prepilin-type N-terminal cleavage/methylation domain-containing protein
MDSSPRRPANSRAFSLIELLVVVGIIVILLSISIAVGFRVSGSGKIRKTEQIISVLDQALASYIQQSGGNPKPYVIDPRPENNPPIQTNPLNERVQPVADAVPDPSVPDPRGRPIPINSVGFFLTQCAEFPSVKENLLNLPAGALKDFDVDGPGSATDYTNQPVLPTVFDAWNNPIRYVHPAFGGHRHGPNATDFTDVYDTTGGGAGILKARPAVNGIDRIVGMNSIRRNGAPDDAPGGDSDGGIPPGAQPYFYSCGPDGDPSTVDDNVYIKRPQAHSH